MNSLLFSRVGRPRINHHIDVQGITCKKCTSCGETKPLEEFHRSSRTWDKRTTRCGMCANLKRNYLHNFKKRKISNAVITQDDVQNALFVIGWAVGLNIVDGLQG